MPASRIALEERVRGGILGLLVGDALGVPYEFRHPRELPPIEDIEMEPPPGFIRSYEHVPSGTWSDDGAQALCLLATLLECGQFHAHDFARRLVDWHDNGYMAVGGYVFDVGNQTSASIHRLKAGQPTGEAGLRGERNNGNGSLMRCLPLALFHRGNDLSLIVEAHRQSCLTHGHSRSQICCALYCLWARAEMQAVADPWGWAVARAREAYAQAPDFLQEMENEVQPDRPPGGTGSGYVVDCLHSARLACCEDSYQATVKAAVALGHDTDTTACVAGGIAGVRWGAGSIPRRWLDAMRGMEKVRPLVDGLVQCGM